MVLYKIYGIFSAYLNISNDCKSLELEQDQWVERTRSILYDIRNEVNTVFCLSVLFSPIEHIRRGSWTHRNKCLFARSHSTFHPVPGALFEKKKKCCPSGNCSSLFVSSLVPSYLLSSLVYAQQPMTELSHCCTRSHTPLPISASVARLVALWPIELHAAWGAILGNNFSW